MEAMYNTLKMMGLNGVDLINFSDAHKMYHLSINPRLKAIYRSTMLRTKILDKTLIQWHDEIVKKGIGNNVKTTDLLHNERRIKCSDFNFTESNVDLQLATINVVIEHVLQEYYKKEKIFN